MKILYPVLIVSFVSIAINSLALADAEQQPQYIPECNECKIENCSQYIQAIENPGQNQTGQSGAWEAMEECIKPGWAGQQQASCASASIGPLYCYCGNQSIQSCFSYGGQGECTSVMNQYYGAPELNSQIYVGTHWLDTNNYGGDAMSLINCVYNNCSDQCGLSG